ncbi:MAG: UvrB/UvrC motif-containing protein, partial [Euryarchaeota archaeon]|nr:UvrB/UvrC motif-containing protein [Euryarchaeota archaeon]
AALDKEMRAAAKALDFEKAALLRDKLIELRSAGPEKTTAPPRQSL